MNKLLIGGLAVAALALTGCVAAPAPVAEPAPASAPMPAPEPTPAPEPQSSASSEDAMFLLMMQAVDTPSRFLEGEALEILQDQARSTCGYIDEGMTADQIVLAFALAIAESDEDEEIHDAVMAATVAATYSYCPEYGGFFG